MDAILKYNFLQNAIMAAILASVACGVIAFHESDKEPIRSTCNNG